MSEPILSIQGLRKHFGTNQVLKGIDLGIAPGKVTALMGANGAGKSTLLSCLSGAIDASEGQIVIDGESIDGASPNEAMRAGISMIYQHFQLIGSLSIADNIFLGSEIKTKSGRIDRKAQNQQAKELFAELNLKLDPVSQVDTLSIGQQQVVEIAKSLQKKPKVLILDEPTSALSHEEVESLLKLVRDLADRQGIAIVYVSHVLSEIMEIADRAVILRDGLIYADVRRGTFTKQDLISYISPNQVTHQGKVTDRIDRNKTVLRLDNVSTNHTGPITVSVNAGEILAVFGLMGSGRTDLLESLAGIRQIHHGDMLVNDRRVRVKSPKQAIESGIALVPSDRRTQALFSLMSARDNVVIPHMSRLARLFRSTRAEDGIFSDVSSSLRVTPNDPKLHGGMFSGGNAQKLMVGRWANPRSKTQLLLLDEPTQGVDIGARQDIYDFLHTYVADESRCAVFATSDYEEAVTLGDRILVLNEGRPIDIVSPKLSESELMSLAFGNHQTGIKV